MQNGIKILEDGRKRFPNQPFRIIQNTREVIVFPERFANTFRNEEGLSFAAVSIQSIRDKYCKTLLKNHSQNYLSKNSLFNIKLVDSAIKEAQRLMPIKHLSMRRIATKDVHVAESNITIRKGEYVTVEDTHGASLPAGEDIQKFDIYR
ncbi:hypothetical protein BM1_03472 [Bipolaris maydis]|nr:hypothetical protein BM1_03472 [Bipolaris maydis]